MNPTETPTPTPELWLTPTLMPEPTFAPGQELILETDSFADFAEAGVAYYQYSNKDGFIDNMLLAVIFYIVYRGFRNIMSRIRQI